METSIHSPRPAPIIFAETPFSQRRRTPFRAPKPPRAPAKSCPPVSRVFNTPRQNRGPQFVSFKSERKAEVLTSPVYDAQSQISYFEQCFEIIEKLGEGSFGEVFKVRSRENGRVYAVKKSRQRFRGEWDRRQKLAEVEKHEWLPPHSNCVQFHRAWEERGHLYIQTELCLMSLMEYADLHQTIPHHRVWGFLIDLVKGLKHLHQNRLCHFDIKPANIFIGQDGLTCKLGDFGLCVSIDHFKDAVEGDATYMAPELMQGNFGKPADVFSLGISLLEVGCDLELPSGGPNWHLLREGSLPHSFTKDLPMDLVAIISRMMHPNPAMRPTVDEILCDSRVRKATYKYSFHKLYDSVIPVFQSFFSKIYSRLLVAWLLLLSIFTGRPPPRDSDCDELESPLVHQDDSFSDDEDLVREYLDRSEDSGDSRFNCSWIHNSPVKYPSPVYSGPPIPLDFGDTSLENSSEEMFRDSPLSSFNHGTNSHDSSFSYTPNSKPSLEELSMKNIHIGPKNLMEVFAEAGD